MNHTLIAEELYAEIKRMPEAERIRFFSLLANNAFRKDDFTHEQVFCETHQEPFSASEAAEYLEISLPTLRPLCAIRQTGAQLYRRPQLDVLCPSLACLQEKS
ncbi:hypothetical protein SAMN05216339_107125 [Nitrosomonas eutropha]|uniref:Uncharacterized protein n=1 Tax=Nitrosomonas eutropha TaxID=916 RepID=A0A1I7I9D9_9PROT|nr:hypothetical protein [Nitrosomonas eutropha]SFU69436.1 hypothetical protein SAMN05216339_107125 [Nitrosomonas eutropha]